MSPETTEPSEHATGLKLKFREQLFTPFTVSFSTRDNLTRSLERGAVASVSLSLCSLGLSDYFTDSLCSRSWATRFSESACSGGGGRCPHILSRTLASCSTVHRTGTLTVLLSRDYNIYNRSILTYHKRNAV